MTSVPISPGQEALVLTKTAMDELLRYLLDQNDQPENIQIITVAAIISTGRTDWLKGE